MDDVFQSAVDSLLSLFGSAAELRNGAQKVPVRTSPPFSSKLKNEKAGTKVSSFSANVIITRDESPMPGILPGKTLFVLNGDEYRISSVFKIESSGNVIAYELEIRR